MIISPDIEKNPEYLVQRPKVLILGPGLVGSHLFKSYDRVLDMEIAGFVETGLDLSDHEALARLIEKESPEVVINYAAFTHVENAEKERGDKEGLAWQANVIGSRNLAKICKKTGAFPIHVSTETVFTGEPSNPGPYAESAPLIDSPDKLSWYGYTKLRGEMAFMVEGGDFAIVRITYPYRAFYPGKTDFVRNILDLYDKGKLYPLFDDQMITLSLIEEVSYALARLARWKKPGIYHVSSSDLTTPHALGCFLLFEARGVKDPAAIIGRKSVVDFQKENPHLAKRPQYGGLRTEMTQEALGIRLLAWKEGVDWVISQLKHFEVDQNAVL